MSTTRRGLRQLATASADAARKRMEPRLATWLTPWLVAGIMLVASTSLADSHRERRAQLVEGAVEQVALLSSVLAITADDLLRHDRAAELDELLDVALQAKEVFATFVLGPGGDVVAGGAADLSCLPGTMPLRLPAHEVHGTVDCGSRVHWRATPLQRGSWLVVGIDDGVTERAEENAFRLQLLLLAGLAVTAAIALTVMRRAPSPGLEE